MKKTIITLVTTLMVVSLSIPSMAQNYGAEKVIAPGIHPHCTRGHDGFLHVVAVNEDKIQYVQVSSAGVAGMPETIASGSDLQAPYIAEGKNKVLHVVWGEGYNAMYSNNMGGSWKTKSMIPTIKGYAKNRFPHVTGGYGNEAYVASWNHNTIKDGVHAAFQVNVDNKGKVTGIKSNVMGKIEDKASSIAGPTALLDCGGKVYAVAAAPDTEDYFAHLVSKKFDVTLDGVLGNRAPDTRWVLCGVEAFPMENGPAMLAELRTSSTPKICGIVVNFKDSGKIGAMFADVTPKWCFPRGTYDPVSKNIYGIYNVKSTLMLGIFNTATFSRQDVSSQPVSAKISAGATPGQCGWGAGGIAARISGGADMVYSVDNTVKLRSIDAR